MLVKAYNLVGKVKVYYLLLRQLYEIIKGDVEGLTPKSILQMAIKAVNNTAGPNSLIPILLIFGSYLRITEDSPLSPIIT